MDTTHEWCVFQASYDLVSPCLPKGPKLCKFSVFIMFFLKIRLNLLDDDIGYWFGVHPSTVSRHFHKVLDVLYM